MDGRTRRRRWRSWIPPLLGILTVFVTAAAAAPRPVAAAYQATADSNESAFEPPCIGWDDPHPERMLSLATTGMKSLGFDVKAYKGAAFTRTQVLNRTVTDVGYYVHSHGDYYWHAGDQRRYSGFREDSGDCTQAVVFSKDIKTKRAGLAANMVIISTCSNGDANTTMPAAFGIAKSKVVWPNWGGAKFYMSYIGEQYDNDEETFEIAFWDALKHGHGVGQSFDLAMLENFTHDFQADWWGSYSWSGHPDPGVVCTRCS